MTNSTLNRASLSLEGLDQRALPSVTPGVLNGFLVLTSDGASDSVFVEDVGTQIRVTVNGQVLGQVARSAFQGVGFIGNGGDDTFVNASSLLAIADGGDGNDTLAGFSNSVNYFIGGNGDDVLIGGDGNDVLLGGSGDDVLFGRGGSDYVVGDDGSDREYGGHDPKDVYDDRGTDADDFTDDNGDNQFGDDNGGNGFNNNSGQNGGHG